MITFFPLLTNNVFKLDFLTPSTCNSCLYVLNNRLPRLARYLQAVFIVSNFLEDLINLKLETLVTASCFLNSSGCSATELGFSSAEASLDTTSTTRVSGPTNQPVLLDNEAPKSVETQCFERHLKGSHI